MPKKKIPGQIRFTPELDCISLERVRQDFGFPSGHKFSQHHRTAGFFQTGYGGPVKVYWFGSCTKKMGQREKGQVHQWSPLVFFSLDFVFLVFVYFCISKNMLFFCGEQRKLCKCTLVVDTPDLCLLALFRNALFPLV